MNPVGILLAAGRGRRFDPLGRQNKLLQALPGGDAVVVASARHLLAVLPRVVAVVPPEDGGVGEALRALGVEVTVCPDADSGMAASLVHAIRHSLPQADAWLVALGDMPHVAPATLRALLEALAAGAQIAAPTYRGQRGNPVAFGQGHLPALLALEGDAGARGLLRSCPVREVAVCDPGILRDIDTPADL
ncbi:nucleotidyltransferase family protein [Massilia sp. Dwa41.01b]|uniref:nucleotidyltransferase family protein n=1 Tax=unclassified Massilia TaxID=2609279 RepID=UPI001600CCD3|nr:MULTISPECIES: nucleotidyltransferase family protein [unclassified Massilia]QNA87785.1 nucleotidyltransferase family protein [Massilia sp. Dwa41.01b]QNA98688.1 nucleotidyltransferase family protein [Massilia sp. Se16.2.3]